MTVSDSLDLYECVCVRDKGIGRIVKVIEQTTHLTFESPKLYPGQMII